MISDECGIKDKNIISFYFVHSIDPYNFSKREGHGNELRKNFLLQTHFLFIGIKDL